MRTRVLLVEDSLIAQAILKRILNASGVVEVVGVAKTGLEALSLIPRVNPDVICTDLHMPQMNGLEFTYEVMAKSPIPILVISASVQEEDTKNVFELLDAGAVDIFPKPRVQEMSEYEAIKVALVRKIQVLSGVHVFTRHRKNARLPAPMPAALPMMPLSRPSSGVSSLGLGRIKMVAIGASTGGPQALKTLLGALPANWSTPVVVVQHISYGFLQGLIDWLSLYCKVPIRIAQQGEYPQAGVVYFPPEQLHLEIDRQGQFRHSAQPKIDGHRPSVTVTMESLAQYYRSAVLGVLLTGMGRDGAAGMMAIAQAGGHTIAQDEASSVVFGMPKEAIALNAARQVLPIDQIAAALQSQVLGTVPL
ncbi:chemotaxis-specific protein-glutamate methyltransferase CheB [Spirulina major CS-329]|uniref:chemotaxis-specific protein-glutamate methyltransferase CheB n=1 Tax=Spirulina TaxID=1154 RepID=UPI00232C9639|nr:MULTISPECIES: chemotaxis-specific protein-glutamate methyltransferase CheB [Spirulina]MDB9495171.1 chemotaxis-specific protein-glutamate methyltransferase CheB [Spirulina subsalsa CS-330]MDB9504788.1 chemotaxis-specific protein-glutamate methyltransferase CheB [Spirulina major CS-329]